ncbi:hypothetical protein Peur_037494 [Populus x canadensis]
MVMADTAAWGCVEMSWSCLGWVLEQRGGGDQGKEAGGLCSLSFTQAALCLCSNIELCKMSLANVTGCYIFSSSQSELKD